MLSTFLMYSGTAAAQFAPGSPSTGWDNPFDHALFLHSPTVGTRETVYGPEMLPWAEDVRVLAVQPLTANYDIEADTSDGNTWFSEYAGGNRDIDFVIFDGTDIGSERQFVSPTATVHSNGITGLFYAEYARARGLDAWDGENGYADLSMRYDTVVRALRLYLKVGRAYRFRVERSDRSQAGFASLVPADWNHRLASRPQNIGELHWWNGGQDDHLVVVPEEGWYTLVVAQINGSALALGGVRVTQVIPRGDARPADNNVRILVDAE